MKLHALVSFLFTSLSLTISANPQTQSTAKPAQKRPSSVSQRRALKKSQSSISNATASHYVAKRAHKSRRTTQQTKENHQFLGLPTLQMSILFASRITGSA